MNDLQREILIIFKEFDRICRKNNLRYYAIGGTCIGAIRHSGFIPWDDDLDVAMPFSDYIRFMRCAFEEIKEPFGIYISSEYQHGNCGYIKLHNKETTFIEKSVQSYPDRYTGVFIDIMPISGLPKNRLKKIKYIKECAYLKHMDYSHRYSLKEIEGIKHKFLRIISSIWRSSLKYNYYSSKLLSKLSEYDFDDSDEVLFSWRIPIIGNYKNVFPQEIFQEGIEVNFEDTIIKVPKEYDMYLKMDFGEYMKLPPLEEQIPLHDYFKMDFNNSYKNYI